MRTMVIDNGVGGVVVVNRALAWWCPTCLATPGTACIDRRQSFDRFLAHPHASRTALRVAADDQWRNERLAARA